MKKYLTSVLCLFLLFSLPARAQFPYTFKVLHEAYQPLTNGISLTNAIWSDENFRIPLGFSFKFDTTSTNTLYLWAGTSVPVGSVLIAPDTTGIIPVFSILNTQLVDRGFGDQSQHKSPIRYTITGDSGSHVLKVEWANAGSRDEFEDWGGTLNDSLNIQVWIYEGSNIVEMRYGPNYTTHSYEYAPYNQPTAGYFPAIDRDAYDYLFLYNLAGDPDNPTLDSIDVGGGYSGVGLDTIPSSGVVYQFTPVGYVPPNPNHVSTTIAPTFHVYPTICKSDLIVDYNMNVAVNYEIVSINGASVSQHGTVQTGKTRIDVSNLASGMYVLKLQSSSSQNVYKFIKR